MRWTRTARGIGVVRFNPKRPDRRPLQPPGVPEPHLCRFPLFPLRWGQVGVHAHQCDKAQAQVDVGQGCAAEQTLMEAHDLSPVWFRHHGPARSLVGRLREQQTRLTPGLRQLAMSVELGRRIVLPASEPD